MEPGVPLPLCPCHPWQALPQHLSCAACIDWQHLVQRNEVKSVVPSGVYSCHCPAMQYGPISCPKQMHGGLGCGDRAELTCLQGHSPCSAHPGAILSCWGIVVLGTVSPQDLPRLAASRRFWEVSSHQWLAGCCFLILLGVLGVTALAAAMGMQIFWLTTKEKLAAGALKSTKNPTMLWPARFIRIPQQEVTRLLFHSWILALEPFKQAHNFIF